MHQLTAHFASSKQCHDISIVGRGDSPWSKEAVDAFAKTTFELIIDYKLGRTKQSWTLVKGHARTDGMSGEGNTKEIVASVCAIVSKRGAKVVNF
jgi:hypothetical protein